MSNQQPLWHPSPATISSAHLTHFMKEVGVSSYEELYEFSIQHPEKFWRQVWQFCGLKGILNNTPIIVDKNNIEKAVFFPKATLNVAENLIVKRDSTAALIFFGEDQVHETVSWEMLYDQVAKLADHFKKWGLQPGDRVAGYLPNLPQTIVAFLATASLGAVWSSCSPDFGLQSVLDRFGQISPKILLMADGYFYNGKTFRGLEKIGERASKRTAFP